MSEMVERVARALCWKSLLKAMYQAAPDEADLPYIDHNYPRYMGTARTAIETMREATDYMTAAAWADTARATPEERMALELTDNRTAFRMKMKRRFAAMITAALADPS